jgi:hypothetical protein
MFNYCKNKFTFFLLNIILLQRGDILSNMEFIISMQDIKFIIMALKTI